MNKIILAADDFEITNFTDEEQVKVQVINAELNQSSWFSNEQRNYLIFNGCHCYQRVQYSKTDKSKFRINLRYLSCEYTQLKDYALGWFASFLILFSAALALLWLPSFSQTTHSSSAILMLFLSLITLLFAFIKTENRLIFVSKVGKAPLLEFIYNSPSTHDLNTFIDVLKNKIKAAEHVKPLSKKQYQKNELNELRRLKNERVVSTQTFNKAMLLLLSKAE